MIDLERNIASFYQDHLYLIDPGLDGKTALAEQVQGKDRLDLLVRLGNGSHSIIEFKRKPILPADVLQLIRYWKKWGKSHRLAAKHYLVGLRPRNAEALEKALTEAPMKVILRLIPEDVPSAVSWSSKERKYVPYKEGIDKEPIELFISR